MKANQTNSYKESHRELAGGVLKQARRDLQRWVHSSGQTIQKFGVLLASVSPSLLTMEPAEPSSLVQTLH
jgi:hypothetical protein